MTYLREQADSASASLSIHVQPKASRTRVAGRHGDALKLCITSPPVDGKANAAVIAFFAKLFKIPKGAVTIALPNFSRSPREPSPLPAARPAATSGLSPQESRPARPRRRCNPSSIHDGLPER